MKKIAIISALGREIKEIRDNINLTKSFEIKGYRFSEGNFNDINIVLGITSVGKVNAALCTEILITNFKPAAIINTGIAGSLSKKTDVLDIVVSKSLTYHDIEKYVLEGCFPHMSNFPVDIDLFKKAKKASESWPENSRIHFGKIISGDSFINSKNEKERLINIYNPLCVEMEGAAIAHVCHINSIPFISFRSISDNADGSARETYKENEITAANQAGKFVLHFLKT